MLDFAQLLGRELAGVAVDQRGFGGAEMFLRTFERADVARACGPRAVAAVRAGELTQLRMQEIEAGATFRR